MLGGFPQGRDAGRARRASLAPERQQWGCPESSVGGIKLIRCPQWF